VAIFTTAGIARAAMSANESGCTAAAAASELDFALVGRSVEPERDGSVPSHRNKIPAIAIILRQCHSPAMVAERLVIAYTVLLRCFPFNPANDESEQTARHVRIYFRRLPD
jgi:hypothetical protein